MCCKGFIKRILPFFLTFAVGLFIASFFVTISAPSFRFENRRWNRHQQYHRQMELEKQRLQEENYRLKKQLADNSLEFSPTDLKYSVPPPPPAPPMPPAPNTVPYRNR